MNPEPGAQVSGEVTRIMPYGAFLSIEGGGCGMLHISEIAPGYVNDIADCLHIGDKVCCVVLGIDVKGRVALSMKQIPKPEKENSQRDFEKMLSHFKQASNKRMADAGFCPDERRRKNRKQKK